MTYAARACPCCASLEHVAYPALVAPFIAAYALEGKVEPTRLLECRGCGFRFFEDRFTDAEAGRLYAGYRGDRYYRERHRHEPWYTRKANEGSGDELVIRARRELVERFLRDHLDVATLDDVLDFGGDRGQLIPHVGKRRFVHEISGVTPVEGVTNLASPAALREHRFDLVLLSHVLEHCSEPSAVLRDVRSHLRSDDSFVYVEVPWERIALRFLGDHVAYRAWLGAIRRVKPLLTAVDLYSTAFRAKFDVVPPLGFVKLHEHVNFFDQRSLRELFAQSGLTPIAVERLEVHSTFGKTPVLSALARPTRATT